MHSRLEQDPPPPEFRFRLPDWLRRAVSSTWLLPPKCLVCGEDGSERQDLCAACRLALPFNRSACRRCALPLPHAGLCGQCQRAPPLLDAVHAAFVYAPPLDRLLPRFKFHRDLPAGRLLAGFMIEAFNGLPAPQALIPIPLHRARLRQRGYDQARELARPLARALDIPLLGSGLIRRQATAPQSELDAAARRRNLRDAFVAGRMLAGTDPLPLHVVLVDDVMTTGATLEAAARVLRRVGVSRVDAWVCARVP